MYLEVFDLDVYQVKYHVPTAGMSHAMPMSSRTNALFYIMFN